MEDFGFFIFLALGITILFVMASIVLKKSIPEKKDKYLSVGFSTLIIISIGIVIISLFVGGWSGMGYGLIGISILIGTILGGLINSVTIFFIGNRNE